MYFLQFWINGIPYELFFWSGFFDSVSLFQFLLLHIFYCCVVFCCLDILQFVYSFNSFWILKQFPILAIKRKASKTIPVQVFLYGKMLSFLLSEQIGEEWLNNMVSCVFTFLRNFQNVFQNHCTISHSHHYESYYYWYHVIFTAHKKISFLGVKSENRIKIDHWAAFTKWGRAQLPSLTLTVTNRTLPRGHWKNALWIVLWDSLTLMWTGTIREQQEGALRHSR